MVVMEPPVWLITGCSSGFGRALAEVLLSRGRRVVATARDKRRLHDLQGRGPGAALLLDLDVTDPAEIREAVARAVQHFGRIDVLVNNAGYGYLSSIEEGIDAEIRRQFDTNVFGLFDVTRAVLPVMRRQRSGHVINITSVAGFLGLPASGYYAASKHAVEGWSDSLAKEVSPLGIRVTCVEPGAFRTDWWGRSNVQTPNRIKEYAATVGERLRNFSGGSSQPGNPVKAAEAIIAIAERQDPPRHLVLGTLGYEQVTKKLKGVLAEVERWRALSLSTDDK